MSRPALRLIHGDAEPEAALAGDRQATDGYPALRAYREDQPASAGQPDAGGGNTDPATAIRTSVLVSVSGTLGRENGRELERQARGLAELGVTGVVVDLSAVQAIDAAGVAALIATTAPVAAGGGGAFVLDLSPEVEKALRPPSRSGPGGVTNLQDRRQPLPASPTARR